MKVFHLWRTALCLSLALLALAAPCQASDGRDAQSLRATIRQMAADLRIFLQQPPEPVQVALGRFDAPLSLVTSGGKGIKVLLAQGLAEEGVRVDPSSRFEIRGEFSYDSDAIPSDLVIYCDIVEQKTRRRVKSYERSLSNIEDLALIFGACGSLSVSDSRQRASDLHKTVVDPKPFCFLDSKRPDVSDAAAASKLSRRTRLAARENSPYAIEICLKNEQGEFIPQEIIDDDRMAFVELPANSYFAIRLINNSGLRAAATVAIDGINLFHFSDALELRTPGLAVIPSQPEGVLIKGWPRDRAFSHGLMVSDAEEEYAAALRGFNPQVYSHGDDLGTISVGFAAAVGAMESLPDDEKLRSRCAGSVSLPSFEAGVSAEQVRLGLMREVVSVRYSRP